MHCNVRKRTNWSPTPIVSSRVRLIQYQLQGSALESKNLPKAMDNRMLTKWTMQADKPCFEVSKNQIFHGLLIRSVNRLPTSDTKQTAPRKTCSHHPKDVAKSWQGGGAGAAVGDGAGTRNPPPSQLSGAAGSSTLADSPVVPLCTSVVETNLDVMADRLPVALVVTEAARVAARVVELSRRAAPLTGRRVVATAATSPARLPNPELAPMIGSVVELEAAATTVSASHRAGASAARRPAIAIRPTPPCKQKTGCLSQA
mmetsp:Transcript_32140/g.81791  ORF Transcript_32140/g.81791 Transcript_32140/m.81791 type:complete len:258 (+) Transcript_32140:752-1525(+)